MWKKPALDFLYCGEFTNLGGLVKYLSPNEVAQLGVTKIIFIMFSNLVILKAPAKHELLIYKLAFIFLMLC